MNKRTNAFASGRMDGWMDGWMGKAMNDEKTKE